MVGNDLPEGDTACASPASAPASDDGNGSDPPTSMTTTQAKERLRREMSRPDVHDVAGDEIDIPRYIAHLRGNWHVPAVKF